MSRDVQQSTRTHRPRKTSAPDGLGGRFLSFVMAVVLAVGLMPLPAVAAGGDGGASGLVAVGAGALEVGGSSDGSAAPGVGGLAAQGVSVRNPRIVTDSSMRAGQRVTWDCVWFGSYPQSEVTSSSAVYSSLQAASWDANGDATVGGVKYRRISESDATYSGYWPSGSATYRYFRYEPVKWRVLSVSGSRALVVSDTALDDQQYNKNYVDVTWETSGIRSWLNGYGASSNQPGADYTGKGFIGSAFSFGERSAVYTTDVANADNIDYGTDGGNDTQDKVFLLSESEVYGSSAAAHGFASSYSTYDEARRCKASDFAHAMGAWTSTGEKNYGNCRWWLRSPGFRAYYASRVDNDGWVTRIGYNVHYGYSAVRPALNLNLQSSYVSYAGTVSSGSGPAEPDMPAISTSIPFYDSHVSMKRVQAPVTLDPSALGCSSTVYNHKLAELSIALSEVAYSEKINKVGKNAYVLGRKSKELGKNEGTPDLTVTPVVSGGVTQQTTYSADARKYSYIYNAFDKLGVKAKDVRVYYYEDGQYSWHGGNAGGYADEGGFGVCAYALGKREVVIDGVKRNLVIVMVRGTASNGEWNSNFNIANAGANEDHQGFAEAERQIMGSLKTFCSGMDASTTKMLVTGHSRGAAVANMLAGELDRDQTLVKRENLFAYTFATPRVTTRGGTRGAQYANIFNILNPEDFVTKVALEKWGYERYGVDLNLPSKTNMHKGYAAAKRKCQAAYATYFKVAGSGYATYQPYDNGTYEVQGLVGAMYLIAPSVYQYYRPVILSRATHNGSYLANTPYDYFQSLASYLANDGKANLAILGVRSISAYAPITAFFVKNEKLDGRVMQAHQPETYFAWIYGYESGGSPYVQSAGGLSSQDAGGGVSVQNEPEALPYDNPYKVQRFSGDVDVRVYDSADDLVCSITDGAVDQGVMAQDNGLAAGVSDSSEAVVYLPSDDSYRFEVSGGDGATMVVESYDGSEALQGRTEGVSVGAAGALATGGTVAEGDSLSGVSVHDGDGNESEVQSVAAESLQTCTVGVARQGGGSAWGGGEVFVGDAVTVHSEPVGDAEFLGWFDGDALVSQDADYRFEAAGDVSLTAKFTDASIEKPTAGSFVYDGQEKRALPKWSGYVLSGDVAATDADSYIVTVAPGDGFTWAGGSKDPVNLTWRIAPASIDGAKLVLSQTDYTYNGKAQKPTVKTVDGKALKAGADYTVKYSNESSAKVGSYTVQAVGKGNYAGNSAKATYKISAKSVKDSTITLSKSSFTYNGKKWVPAVKSVKVGALSLKSGTDYTLSYLDPLKKAVAASKIVGTGTYYVKVTAKGNYTGSVTKKFTIAKAANPMNVAAKTAKVSYSKKKARTVKAASAYNFKKKAVGKVTYARVAKGSSKWLPKVNAKTGAITVKAATPKGKTYSVKVKVAAKGNANYKSASKTITVKVRVR